MAAKNEMWIIVVILIVAGVLIAMSLTKDKSKVQPVASAPVAVDVIKPDHSAGDMEKIAATRTSTAIVEEPKVVTVKQAYAIQVFSFKDKNRADASLNQLKAKGYPAYVMMSDLGPRGIFYRVRVGSFASEEEAKKNLEGVTRDFKSGIIVAE